MNAKTALNYPTLERNQKKKPRNRARCGFFHPNGDVITTKTRLRFETYLQVG